MPSTDKRVPALKRARRFARYCLLRALYAAASLLPLNVAMALGRTITGLGMCVPKLRRKVLANLATAYPELGDGERERIARACFEHFGNFIGEVCRIEAITRDIEGYVELSPEDRARYEGAIAEGQGVLLATGHVGNFELMARRLGLIGHPASVVAKVSSDPHMTAFIDRLRRRGGYNIIWRGRERGAAFDGLNRALDRGEAIGLLIDQDTRGRGLFVDFFGKPAHTQRGIADLAIERGCPVITAFIHRKPEGGHVVVVERVAVERTGDRERDVAQLLQTLTLSVERAIRRDPGAWPWFHERWKHLPPPAVTSGEAVAATSASAAVVGSPTGAPSAVTPHDAPSEPPCDSPSPS